MVQDKKSSSDLLIVLILGVFTFIVGTAWNELINELIEAYFPNSKNNLWYRLGYVIALTIVVIIFVIWAFGFLQRLPRLNNL